MASRMFLLSCSVFLVILAFAVSATMAGENGRGNSSESEVSGRRIAPAIGNGVSGNSGAVPTGGSGATGITGNAGGAGASTKITPKPRYPGEGSESCFDVFIEVKKYCFDFTKLVFLEPYYAKKSCCKSIKALSTECQGEGAIDRANKDEKANGKGEHGVKAVTNDKYKEFYGIMVQYFCDDIEDNECDCK